MSIAQVPLHALLADRLDWRHRGFPPTEAPVTIETVGEMGWNVFRDLPMPVMVLKRGALTHNIARMAGYCREHGVLLAPHGKTTMAPQIFERQLSAGAWGLTAATASHVRVYRAFGVNRIILANQLVDPGPVRWLATEIARDSSFDFYCLVDSCEAVAAIDKALETNDADGPIKVLIELGLRGGRAGCRSQEAVMALAAAVAASPSVELAGVEVFEGIAGSDRSEETLAVVDNLLRWQRDATIALEHVGAFDGRERVVVTAGGSAFFDRAVDVLTAPWPFRRPVDIVLRSGCYVTHDSLHYERLSPLANAGSETGLRPALEVWGTVLARPEPELAIVGVGKRDVSYDLDLPVPILIHGPSGLRAATEALALFQLNDQHAFVRVPAGQEVLVGELMGFGISHPCTAFDKWGLIPEVDDSYEIVGAVRTLF